MASYLTIFKKEGTIYGVDRGLAGKRGDHTVDQPQSSDLVYTFGTTKDGPLASPESQESQGVANLFLLTTLAVITAMVQHF